MVRRVAPGILRHALDGRWHMARADHHLGHLGSRELPHRTAPHHLPTPQHRDFVGKRLHLTQLVGDHQDGQATLARHAVQEP